MAVPEFVTSITLVFFLVQYASTSPVSGFNCDRTIQIHSEMSCEDAASLCLITGENLLSFNPGLECNAPLPASTDICCELKGSAVDVNSNPDACFESCPDVFDPVCGADGVTYDNECFFNWSKCANPHTTMEPMTKGACREEQSTPLSLCRLQFRTRCKLTFSPVCGTDGTVYLNLCFLNLNRCKKPLTRLSPAHPRFCRRRGRQALSSHCGLECSEDDLPVCGSNEVTYKNDCYLHRGQCQESDKDIQKISDAACQPGELAKCSQVCPDIVAPVCGSDGISYMNSCYLDRMACRFPNQVLGISTIGICATEREKQILDKLIFAGVTGAVFGSLLGSLLPRTVPNAALINGVNSCFTTAGQRCIFPFTFDGVTFNRCTTFQRGFSWCATSIGVNNIMLQFGRCGTGCAL